MTQNCAEQIRKDEMRRHLQEEIDNHNTALRGLSRQHQRCLFDQGRSMQRDSRKGWFTGGIDICEESIFDGKT